MRKPSTTTTKPPLRWTGVIFALAANLLLATAADMALGNSGAILSTIIAPLVAGGLTAFYTQVRGGMHAFLGGILSIPLMGIFIFPGLWQVAILSAAFCTLGGAMVEIVLRRRGNSSQ